MLVYMQNPAWDGIQIKQGTIFSFLVSYPKYFLSTSNWRRHVIPFTKCFLCLICSACNATGALGASQSRKSIEHRHCSVPAGLFLKSGNAPASLVSMIYMK